MKTNKITCALFAFMILFRTLSPSQGKSDGLLAEPYPGSIAETHPGETDPSTRKVMEAQGRTYYTKDPLEKVLAHYTKSLAKKFEVLSESENTHTCAVIPSNQVYDIVTKRGGEISEGGGNFQTFAGITISGPPKNGSTNYSVVKVYESLDKAYALGLQEGDPAKLQKRMDDPELTQVKAQYEHLKVAYFMETNQPRRDNMPGTLKMDEVLYGKYYTFVEETRKKELDEIQKKYTAAMTKMKYDEATKLGDQMMKYAQPDAKDDWNTALKCLQEMEKHAYVTKIVIDMHPSKWDLTPIKQ